MRHWLVEVAVTLAIAAGTIAATAADWPAKPVRIVSPFAPGGTSDTLGRLLAEQLTDKFGQNFFVENRGGAGGLIGSAAVASAEPDGITFLISSIGTHVTSPATSPNPAYDPLRLFTHIAYLGGPPNVIVVHPSLGVKTRLTTAIWFGWMHILPWKPNPKAVRADASSPSSSAKSIQTVSSGASIPPARDAVAILARA